MTDDRTTYARYDFSGMHPIDRPDWYRPVAEADENPNPLEDAGYHLLQTFSDVDWNEVELYHSEERSAYLAEYWSRGTLIVVLFIPDHLNYLHFRAKLLAPWVALIAAK